MTPLRQGWRRWAPWLTAAAGLLVGGVVVALLTGGSEPASEPVRRFEVQIADSVLDWSLGSGVVLSPDGNYLAYVEGGGNDSTLFLRPLDQFEGHRVAGGTGTEASYSVFLARRAVGGVRHTAGAQKGLGDGWGADHPLSA